MADNTPKAATAADLLRKTTLAMNDSLVANQLLVNMCLTDKMAAVKYFEQFAGLPKGDAKARVDKILADHAVAARGEELHATKKELSESILETIDDNEIPDDVAGMEIRVIYTKGELTRKDGQVIKGPAWYVAYVSATLEGEDQKPIVLSKIAKSSSGGGGGNGTRSKSVPIPDGATFTSWKGRADELNLAVGKGSAAKVLERAKDEVYLNAKKAHEAGTPAA